MFCRGATFVGRALCARACRTGTTGARLVGGAGAASFDKTKVFEEIYRVLKPGGRLYLSDVMVARELTLEARSDPEIWAACIGGALTKPDLMRVAEDTGFVDCKITETFDCFKNTSAEDKVSKDLHVHGANFHARKPV